MTQPEPSGEPEVDRAVAALSEVASLAPREQVAVYTEAHRTLQQALNTIEER